MDSSILTSSKKTTAFIVSMFILAGSMVFYHVLAYAEAKASRSFFLIKLAAHTRDFSHELATKTEI